jgi:hypothetical protein
VACCRCSRDRFLFRNTKKATPKTAIPPSALPIPIPAFAPTDGSSDTLLVVDGLDVGTANTYVLELLVELEVAAVRVLDKIVVGDAVVRLEELEELDESPIVMLKYAEDFWSLDVSSKSHQKKTGESDRRKS